MGGRPTGRPDALRLRDGQLSRVALQPRGAGPEARLRPDLREGGRQLPAGEPSSRPQRLAAPLPRTARGPHGRVGPDHWRMEAVRHRGDGSTAHVYIGDTATPQLTFSALELDRGASGCSHVRSVDRSGLTTSVSARSSACPTPARPFRPGLHARCVVTDWQVAVPSRTATMRWPGRAQARPAGAPSRLTAAALSSPVGSSTTTARTPWRTPHHRAGGLAPVNGTLPVDGRRLRRVAERRLPGIRRRQDAAWFDFTTNQEHRPRRVRLDLVPGANDIVIRVRGGVYASGVYAALTECPDEGAGVELASPLTGSPAASAGQAPEAASRRTARPLLDSPAWPCHRSLAWPVERERRAAAGDARPHRPARPGDDGAAPCLCAREPSAQVSDHPMTLNQEHALPGARPDGAEGLDQGRLGPDRVESRSQYYSLTRAGERALTEQAERWRRLAGLVDKLLHDPERRRRHSGRGAGLPPRFREKIAIPRRRIRNASDDVGGRVPSVLLGLSSMPAGAQLRTEVVVQGLSSPVAFLPIPRRRRGSSSSSRVV